MAVRNLIIASLMNEDNRNKLEEYKKHFPCEGVIVDIGSEKGQWTIAALEEGFDFAVCVEVFSDRMDKLLLTAKEKGFLGRICPLVAEVVPGWQMGSEKIISDGRLGGPCGVFRIGFNSVINFASRLGTINLVKIDIEGAECPVLIDSPTEWMTKVTAMNLELHANHTYKTTQGMVSMDSMRSWLEEKGWGLDLGFGNWKAPHK